MVPAIDLDLRVHVELDPIPSDPACVTLTIRYIRMTLNIARVSSPILSRTRIIPYRRHCASDIQCT